MRLIGYLLLLVSSLAWGDNVQEGKDEAQQLMDSVLPFAEQMLNKHGEFVPYGGAMKSNGEIISVAGTDGEEQPKSTDIIQILQDGFRNEAENGNYKATAIVYDVRVRSPERGDPSDAIAIALDHKSGYSVVVLLPYKLENGQLEYGQISAQAGENSVFK